MIETHNRQTPIYKTMQEEEVLQALGISAGDDLNPSKLRKYYLRAALASHPDKNPQDKDATRRFAALQEAYTFLLEQITAGDQAAKEQAHTKQLFDIFLRAMRGENVENELKILGVHRPPDLFGIDLTVPFSRQLPTSPDDQEDSLDIKTAFAEAFADSGLDDEGNPLEGWARPPVVDLDDL